jgi:hypothetical protein
MATTLTKRTSRNQVTLPSSLIKDWGDADYFSVTRVGDHLELRPALPAMAEDPLEKFRRIMDERGITDEDIDQAVREVRAERGALEGRSRHQRAGLGSAPPRSLGPPARALVTRLF